MYYLGVPPLYRLSSLPSQGSVLLHFFHGGTPVPLTLAHGGAGGELMEGRWRDAQCYHHMMQPEQQALATMEARGAELLYHHPYTQHQQYYHYYQYQQVLQQDEEEAQEEQEEQQQ